VGLLLNERKSMKHNTHIYIASKAIEFLRDSVDTLRYLSGSAYSEEKNTITTEDTEDTEDTERIRIIK
jgi:hypothetical protein